MVAEIDFNYASTRPSKVVSRLMSHFMLQGRPITTRWRWLNLLIFTQFSIVRRMPLLKKVEKPIYILGTGRSGTTILGKVMSLHPDLLFLNEPKALWHAIFPDEDLIGSYTHSPARYRLGVEDVDSNIIRTAHKLYGYCLMITNSRRILDKYPEMIFRVEFLAAIFPDVKFIFLVRNGLDTIRSISLWSNRERVYFEEEIHDWWGVNQRKWRLLVDEIVYNDPSLKKYQVEISKFSRDEDMAAVEWLTTVKEGIHLLKTMPNRIHLVRYEDLLKCPDVTLRELLEFCELPDNAKLITYAQRVLNPVSHQSTINIHPAIETIISEVMDNLDTIK